jgi:TPR repeat protein
VTGENSSYCGSKYRRCTSERRLFGASSSPPTNALYRIGLVRSSLIWVCLHVSYDRGQGTAEDHQAAFAWYLRAAQAGMAKAQASVALMYEQGDGVTQSDSDAVAWYEKAAAQDYPFAMTQLGVHLRLGKGVPWSEAQAMQWFRKAADKGSVGAMTALGLGYKNGLGKDAGQGIQDYRQAAYWFDKAAQQGDGFGQINLGYLYEKGLGVNQDFNRARHLYAQAAGNSDPEIAKLGKEYFSDVATSPAAAPDRTTISSAHDSSDFWAKVIVAGIVVAGVAALTSSSPSDSTSGPTSTDMMHNWKPPRMNPTGPLGLPCTPMSYDDPNCN